MVPRQTRPATTSAQRRATQNLLDAIGGPEYVIPRLQASGDKKAQRLAEIMQAADFESTSFMFKLKSVGMPVTQFTEILLDVNQASAIARLITGVDRVAEDIMSKAVDQFEPHRQCLTSGRILRELEDGTLVPTDVECFDCQGSGYLLKSAEREWVELYLELVRMRKNAPMVAINNSRQVLNQQMNVYGDLASPDGAPSIDSIIKRADDQMLTASADHRLTDGSERERMPDFVGGMPEDDVEVVEAEVVVAGAVSV